MQKLYHNKGRITIGIVVCIGLLLCIDILVNIFIYDNINEMISLTFWIIIFPFIFTIIGIIMSIGFFYSSTIENKKALKVNTAMAIIENVKEEKRLLLYQVVNEVLADGEIDIAMQAKLTMELDYNFDYLNVILDLLGYGNLKLNGIDEDDNMILTDDML